MINSQCGVCWEAFFDVGLGSLNLETVLVSLKYNFFNKKQTINCCKPINIEKCILGYKSKSESKSMSRQNRLFKKFLSSRV